MLDHISLGVSDIARTRRFYDAALAPLGYRCLSDGADSLGYGRDAVALWLGATARPDNNSAQGGVYVPHGCPRAVGEGAPRR